MTEPNRCDWFSRAGFGMFTHWTTETLPQSGEKKSFDEAVSDFRLDEYVEQVAASGAKFLFFTITHAKMFVPFPCPELDAIVPGHTCRRDLMGELADKLAERGIKLMFYFNGDGSWDPAWQQATAYHSDPGRHAEIVYALITAISRRYGRRIAGWWIDCCYDGIMSNESQRYDFPRYAEALRAGNPDSIVAFNFKGVFEWNSRLGIGISDYQAGEENDIERLPSSRFSGEGGTQWFALCPMDAFWVYDRADNMPVPRYEDDAIADYVRQVREKGGVFAYNAAPYQEGMLSAATAEQLRRLGKKLLPI